MSTSTTASLSALPNELLIDIVSYIAIRSHFPDVYTVRALHSLSLVNRRFHCLCAPHLYSIFSFDYGHPHLLLRTLCVNPQLASHLKAISWDYRTQSKNQYPHDRTACSRELVEKLESDPRHIQLAEEVDTLPYSGDQRLLNIFLLFTPNVEHLRVAETFRWDDHIYWFQPILDQSSHAFSSLTSATIQGPMRLENIAPLLLLHSLRRLHLTQVGKMRREPGRIFEWDANPDRAFTSLLERHGSNVVDLNFEESHIAMEDLAPVFSAIRELKNFGYEHGENVIGDAHILGVNAYALMEGLKRHAKTLERLDIWTEESWPLHNYMVDFLTSLQSFPNLRPLSIGPLYCSLNPPDDLSNAYRYASEFTKALPTTLGMIRLTVRDKKGHSPDHNTTQGIDLIVKSLAAGRSDGRWPHMQAVILGGWDPFRGCFPPHVGFLMRMCEHFGIYFASVPRVLEEGEDDLVCRPAPGDEDWELVDSVPIGQTR